MTHLPPYRHRRALQAWLGRLVVASLPYASLTPYGAHAQPALPTGADAFVASAHALAKSANERIELGRSNARLEIVRLALTDQLIRAKSGDVIRFNNLNEVLLLCGVRGGDLLLSAQRNYLQAVAAKIEEVGRPAQIDNLASAVKTLFSSQSLDVTNVASNTELANLTQRLQERCERDLTEYDKTFYGKEVRDDFGPAAALDGPAEAFSFLGPIGGLIDAIVGVITPVVVEGAKIIDEERRREVVREFLRKTANREHIKASGLRVAEEVSRFVLTKRRKLAGRYVEQLVQLRGSAVELAKVDACKSYLAEPKKLGKRASGAPSDEFVLCWRASWSQLEGNVAAALKAAADYDELSDAGDSDNAKKAFEPLSNALDAIPKEQFSPDDLGRLWALATRLVAFAEKVHTSFAKENRDKIQKAIDELVKG